MSILTLKHEHTLPLVLKINVFPCMCMLYCGFSWQITDENSIIHSIIYMWKLNHNLCCVHKEILSYLLSAQ